MRRASDGLPLRWPTRRESMPPVATAAVAVAALLDLAVAEPPRRLHTVAWFGRAVAPLDRASGAPRLVGLLAAAALPLGAAALSGGFVAVAAGAGPVPAAGAAALVLFSATSLRMLLAEARGAVDGSETDLAAARAGLPALVGRAPGDLSAGQVRSAAVESAAENLADGLVGPLLAFAVLAPASVPLAAAGAAWVKAVNTMDSTLGYPGKPVGWASARLDDLVMWVPARVAAGLLAVAARSPGTVLAARRWAREPTSPNAGWPMATLAAALGVRLEKPGAYVLNAEAALPSAEDARRGVRLVGVAGGLAFVGAGVVAWA